MVEFRQDKPASGPVITGFTRTGFKLGNVRHDGGLILTPEKAMSWNAPGVDALTEAHLESLLSIDPLPEFILLGTGPGLLHPSRKFVAAMEARAIGVEVMDSRAAARAWIVLRAEDRWIAAALMPIGCGAEISTR